MTTEILSPFVAGVEDGPALTELLTRQQPSLFKDLLTDARAVADRMLDPSQAAAAMSRTLGLLVVGAAIAGAFLASLSGTDVLRATFLMPLAIVLALGAAMGPVAATAVMAGARMPWNLLAAALTSAVTAGVLTLLALIPFAVVAMRIDAHWAGPLTIVGTFGVAGVVAGRRIRTMLGALAAGVSDRSGTAMAGEVVERIALVGRVALVQLAFTMSIALWSIEVLR